MIRKAEPADMHAILDIYKAARDLMKKTGNAQQWGDGYPPVDMLEADIRQGHLYVIVESGAVHGVFAFIIGEEPTYRTIQQGRWKNDAQYGTIHRIAGDGAVKGAFDKCLAFCKTLCDNIRIDTHHDNRIMQHLIEKNGFEKCGVIHVEDGSPRIAYQYTGANLLQQPE